MMIFGAKKANLLIENIDKYFENKKFLDTGTVFTNSKCIFIDFYDIVKSPAIPILLTLKELSATKEIRGFDISPLGNLSVAGVIEWYVNRKNKKNFPRWKNSRTNNFYARNLQRCS